MRLKFVSIVILLTFVLIPNVVSARFFDPNDILTDTEMFNGSALSRTAIQRFLEEKNSVLKDFVQVVNGVPKLVSEMIYELGKQNNISQKFLLAKLQHEQGLIEKTTAAQTALDWSTGYSCFNNRCNDKYKGMYAQLDAAATVQRIYAERSQSSGYFGYEVGKPSKTKDAQTVTPANQATTNLYIYTPYQGGLSGIGGNFAFWRVWGRYFTERTYPDGALLRNKDDNTYWKIEDNKKRAFGSEAIFLKDHKPTDAVAVDSNRLSFYQNGDPITIANNTVITGGNSGLLYLYVDNKKYRFVGSNALAALGFRIASAGPVTPVVLSQAVFDALEEGEPITESSIYPQGALVKSATSGIFFVQHGIRRPLLDEAVWEENFGKEEPIVVSQATLAGYAPGDPIMLEDGSIVKNSANEYYVISEQKKKKFTSAAIVSRVYGVDAVTLAPVASAELLSLHDNGDSIDYIDDSVIDPANYVPYADRVAQQKQEQKSNLNLAQFESIVAPETMLVGSTVTITIRFKNRGSATWQEGKTYLKLLDENHPTSSFIAKNRVLLAQAAPYNELASFTLELNAPSDPTTIKEWFILEYEDALGNIVEMPGGLVSRELSVTSGTTAEIVSHSVPIALKNTYKPQQVEIKMKNTSSGTIWTSRRAALMLTGKDGGKSPFYDQRDWIDAETVGVPVNASYIQPGQTGVIRFTLDPRNVAPGTYELRFSLELRDTNERVYLNGREEWTRAIRIDS